MSNEQKPNVAVVVATPPAEIAEQLQKHYNDDVLKAAEPECQISNGLWPYEVGKAYLVMTVSHYWAGIVVAGNDKDILLAQPSWIPDTGRLSEALPGEGEPKFQECEPIPIDGNLIINRGAIVATLPVNAAPTKRKG